MQKTVFTTLLIEDGHALYLDAHLERLANHAAACNVTFFLDKTALLKQIHSFTGLWRLRLIVDHNGLQTEFTPYSRKEGPYRLCIYPKPIEGSPLKTLPYTHREQIMAYAQAHGFDDALTFSPEGYVLETAYANLFWKLNQKVYTPDPSLPLLYGIAIQQFELSNRLIKVKVKIDNLPSKATYYLCNSLRGVRPVEIIV